MASHSFDRIKIPASFWRDLPKLEIREQEVIHRVIHKRTYLATQTY
jgi:hypothetical protein